MTEKFESALEGFRAAVDETVRAHFASNGYTFATPGTIVKRGGKRYAKLASIETRGDETVERGVHSFVEIATGLIFKPASYKAPAKHARGSIYENNGRDSLTDMGSIRYMR